MVYLIVFKGYSVMRCTDAASERWDGKWSACDQVMSFDFSHNGSWATGDSPQDAAINLLRMKARKSK